MTLLLLMLLKSLLVFAAAGVLLLCLRRASAAARHLVCLLTLAALFVLPALSVTLPSWRVAVTQAQERKEPTPPRPSATLPKREGEEFRSNPASQRAETPRPPASGGPLRREARAKQGGGFPFLAFYLLGLLLAFIRPLLGLWGISRLSRACTPIIHTPILGVSAECAAVLELKRLPLLCQADVPVPMTWGGRRPIIALPPASADWPTDRLHAVLLHEMAHVKRRDWICHRFADFTCAIYWFHPLVWLTARRLRAESEIACDDLVLASGIPAPDYARHLLDIARALPPSSRRPPHPAAIAMAQTPHLKRRILMILDKTQSRRTVTRRVLLVPGAAALITLAALRPDAKAQSAPASTPDASAAASFQPAIRFMSPVGSKMQIHRGPHGEWSITVRPETMTTASSGSDATTLLAGITDETQPSGLWWNAQGMLLSKSVFAADASSAVQPLPGQQIRLLAFRLPATAQDVTVQYRLPQSLGYSSDGAWPGKILDQTGKTEAQLFSRTGGARIVTAQYPASLARADLQVGVASGAWKIAASAGTNSSMATNLSQSGFVIGHAVETKDGLSLTVSTDTADDVRVVAADTQGREILPNSIGGQSINKLDQITAQFNEPLSQITAFRVETRPFQWIEYKDVALKPVQ